jgi:hypothetical protein
MAFKEMTSILCSFPRSVATGLQESFKEFGSLTRQRKQQRQRKRRKLKQKARVERNERN